MTVVAAAEASAVAGLTVLSTTTVAPPESRFCPAVTTWSPGSRPLAISTSPRARRPALDEDLLDLQRRVLRLAVLAHDIDRVAVEVRGHRRLRQRDHRRLDRLLHAHPQELAGVDLPVRLLDHGAHADEAGVRVDLRLDRDDLAVELGAADLGRDDHRHADLDEPDLLLGDREVDPHGVDVLQRRIDRAGLDVAADLELRDADHARERCLERLLLEHGLQLQDFGRRVGHIGARHVEVGDRHDAALAQRLDPLQRLLGEVELGPRRLEVGPLDPVVDLDQLLPLLDPVVGLEQDLAHDARRLDAEVDALRRVGGADRLELGLPRLGLRLDHRDRHRRRLHGGEVALDRLVTKHVEADDAADHDDEQHHSHDKTPDHRYRFLAASAHMRGPPSPTPRPAITLCSERQSQSLRRVDVAGARVASNRVTG